MHERLPQPPIEPRRAGAAPLRPLRRRRRFRPLRWLAALGVVVLLLAGALVAMGPWIAEKLIADKLHSEAEARGVDIGWVHLEVGYDLHVGFDKLHASVDKGPTLQIESLTAQWIFRDLFDGRKQPRSLDIEGLDLDVDVEALRALIDARGDTPETPAETPAPRRDPLWMLEGVAISLDGGRLYAHNLPGPVPKVELTDVAFAATPDKKAWSGSLTARCKTGCGDPQTVEGSLARDLAGLRAIVMLETALTFDVPLPDREETLPITFDGVEASLSPALRKPTVAVRNVKFPIDMKGFEGGAVIAKVEAEIPSDGGMPERVALQNPIIDVRPWPNPAPRQQPLSSDWVPNRKRKVFKPRFARRPKHFDYTNPDRPRILDKLPMPSRLLRWRDKALPMLRKASIEDGEVKIEGQLHLKGVSVRHDGDVVHVGLSEGDGEVSVALREGTRELGVRLDSLPVGRLEAMIGKPGWRVDGRLTGALEVKLGGAPWSGPATTWIETGEVSGGFHVKGELEVVRGLLHIPALSEDAIEEQRAKVDLRASYLPPALADGEDRLQVQHLAVSLPSRRHKKKKRWAKVMLEAEINHLLDGEAPDIAGRLWMDKTRCSVAIGSIPEGMLPTLHDQIKVRGSFAPDLTVKVDLANPYGLELDFEGLPGSCRLLSLGDRSPAFLNDKWVREVREGVSRSGILIGPGAPGYTRLYGIPNWVRVITYQTEEGGFFNSSGFSLSLIKKAIRLNLDRGRYAYGGSTLSQQLVKNLFMTRRKTLSRKLEEAFIVWKMEEIVDKERILELYLNCIEYGPDLYGIRRAARFYFGKSPGGLSPIEGAYLAALKPSPHVGMNFMGAGHTPASGFWYARMEGLMAGMMRRGVISRAQYEAEKPFIVFFRTFGRDRAAFRAKVAAELGLESAEVDPITGKRTPKRRVKGPGPKKYRLKDLPRLGGP